MTGPTGSEIITGSVSDRRQWCGLPRRTLCVHLFASPRIHVCVYKYVCVHVGSVYVRVCRCDCMCIHMCAHAMYTHAHIHMCYMHVCTRVCGRYMCVCVFLYICCMYVKQLTAEITFSSFATREKSK